MEGGTVGCGRRGSRPAVADVGFVDWASTTAVSDPDPALDSDGWGKPVLLLKIVNAIEFGDWITNELNS